MRSYQKKVWTCTIIVTFILFFYAFSFAQTESITGVQFKDGSIIYGKVIKLNVYDIQIETTDGKVISRKFDEVDFFYKDTGVAEKQEVKQAPVEGKVSQDVQVDKERPAVSSASSDTNFPRYAQETGLYIGVGGNYAFQNFDTSDLNNDLRPYGLNVDFSDSPGFNAKIGYHFNKLFSAEFVYDYFTDFSWSQTTRISGVPATFDAKIKLMTFMIAGKLSPDIGSQVVRPYITAGAGMMHGNIDMTGSAAGFVSTASDSENDLCAKLGVGVDFYAIKNISIGIEGSYVMGFGNMDNMKYMNLNFGVAYHF